MQDMIKATKKRLYNLKNEPLINPFFSLIEHFEKKDNNQVYKKETFIESLKLSFMFLVANLFSLAFFILAARTLGVVDYSELGVMLSIFFIFAVATNLLNIVIIKYLSYFIAKTQYEKISRFCDLYLKITALGGLIALVIMVLFSSSISKVLDLTQIHVIYLGVLIWAFLIWNSLIGILNGLQYFTLLGLNKIFQAFFSTLLGLLFLFLGLKAKGVIFGMAIGTFVAIPLAMYSARNIFFIKQQNLGKMNFLKYLVPNTLVIICVGVMLNIDLPLVRFYLSAFESGNYAAISLLSSIVFSFSMVSSMVMFPKVAHLASNGQKTWFLLRRALKYVIIMSLVVTLLYFIFSKTIVNLVFGSEFNIAHYIGMYALAMSLLSVSGVLIMYNLALEKRFLVHLVAAFTIVEILLITLVHATIWHVIILLVVFHLLFLAVLIKFTDPNLAFLDKIPRKKEVKEFFYSKKFV